MTIIKKYNIFITENINANILPYKKINTVYHVGDMNINNKSQYSLEGSGLSISLNPNAWKQIAKIGGKDTYKLHNKNGFFIDAYKLNKKQKNLVTTYGLEHVYILQEETYRIYYYDDELEQEVYTEYDNYEEAQREVDDISDIQIYKKGIKPTEKLRNETKQNIVSTSQTFDLLLTIYGEKNTDFDGIWWNDKLDVLKYSAPRGVIFNTKINDWIISKV